MKRNIYLDALPALQEDRNSTFEEWQKVREEIEGLIAKEQSLSDEVHALDARIAKYKRKGSIPSGVTQEQHMLDLLGKLDSHLSKTKYMVDSEVAEKLSIDIHEAEELMRWASCSPGSLPKGVKVGECSSTDDARDCRWGIKLDAPRITSGGPILKTIDSYLFGIKEHGDKEHGVRVGDVIEQATMNNEHAVRGLNDPITAAEAVLRKTLKGSGGVDAPVNNGTALWCGRRKGKRGILVWRPLSK